MFSNRRTILHIDDDPMITRIVGRFLTQAGYEVDSLHEPLQALETIEREQYQVVLLDVDMPIKNGMHLLPEIKSLERGVQVIMLSGIVTPSIVLEAFKAGAEAYLFKPFDDPSPLLDTLAASFHKIDRWWGSLRDLNQRQKAQLSPAGANFATAAYIEWGESI